MTSKELVAKLASPHPEDLFGNGVTQSDVNAAFKQYVKLVHPDTAKDLDASTAKDAFDKLNKLAELAEIKLKNGTYGDKTVLPKPITVGTKKQSYSLTHKIGVTTTSIIYKGTSASAPIRLKVVKSPADNDLLKNEVIVLKELHSNPKTKDLNTTASHLPKIVDSFTYVDGGKHREAVVFEEIKDENYSMEYVLKAYPKGVPLVNLSWMFNRLLGALEGAHTLGIVHGAIVPANFLICPTTHNGVLINWDFSVKVGEKLKAIAGPKSFYPDEVFNKKEVNLSLDLYMAAKLFIHMSGGSVLRDVFPTNWIPDNITADQLKGYKNIQGLMKACLLGPTTRSNDVGVLYTEFRAALKLIFGPPKWHDFTVPKVP